MTKIIISVLILAATTFVADARSISVRSYDQMDRMSDIIVVAKPISTTDTAERTNLPHISSDIPIVGLSSEFEVSLVLKGDTNLTKLVVHHYRLANPVQWVGSLLLHHSIRRNPRAIYYSCSANLTVAMRRSTRLIRLRPRYSS